jgi:hypothetical protein
LLSADLGLTAGTIACTLFFTLWKNMYIILATFVVSGFIQSGLWPGTTGMIW